MDQDTLYVAFDTSKETLAVAIAEGGGDGDAAGSRPRVLCSGHRACDGKQPDALESEDLAERLGPSSDWL